jgi:hypothetical protein
MAEGLRISCDDCVMQNTDACADCVVTFICGRDPHDAVIIDADEERAVRMLARNGLMPELRHAPAPTPALRVVPGGAGGGGAAGVSEASGA